MQNTYSDCIKIAEDARIWKKCMRKRSTLPKFAVYLMQKWHAERYKKGGARAACEAAAERCMRRLSDRISSDFWEIGRLFGRGVSELSRFAFRGRDCRARPS